MSTNRSSIQSKLVRWTVALFALLLLGAAGLYSMDRWVMPAYTHYQKGVTVPDVTKVSYEEAGTVLASYGLRFEVLDRRSHAAYPANFVIDQAPTHGQIVKPNRKIYLTVNTTESPTATVPDLTNMSLRNARIQLQHANLQLGVVSYESSRFRNTVLRQSLPPGEVVAQGSSIDLAVSDGLGDQLVSVPAIRGELLPDAQRMIREAGLRIGDVRFVPDRVATPNSVLDLSPDRPQLREGESIDLVISERYDVQEESESGVILDEDGEGTLDGGVNLAPETERSERGENAPESNETAPSESPSSPSELEPLQPLER